ncbi:universal stress protein [Streptomyces spectabilis]|uniref:Universal stress protein n=1 Tax=Streptomyces spectabilis TaxID=68270 RepID=A0A516RII6_STRST|nr:universal stress protein [Streptomyces spectabilis]QDQ15478.1 universal stress protein [Streptomyces spectabilis]
MEHPLIVGVDGSEPSLRALDWAVDEADRQAVPLRIVHASSWEWYEGREPSFGINRALVRAQADRVVADAAERAHCRSSSVKVTSQMLDEDPAAALIRESRRASGVLVGSRGRGGLAGLLLGSVSLSVAAHAECPVIVVRGEAANLGGSHRRVAVGVDEAADARPALDFAVRCAQRRGATLDLVHAWRCPAHEAPERPRAADAADTHQERAERAADEALSGLARTHSAVPVHRRVVEGSPRAALLDAAATADLLVVGARRRAGRVGMQLGSVNHAVLHHAACPVAVVPHA